MQRVVKRVLKVMVLVLAVGMVSAVPADARAKTATRKVTMDLGDRVQYKRPAMLNKAETVRVKSSKKSVVSVKYKKNRNDRRIAFSLKKKGNATVTLKCVLKNGQRKTVRYQVRVVRKHTMTALERGRKAFAIQNRYRKSGGREPLAWSEELYRFALYRIKHSGYDRHKNHDRDKEDYFKGYAEYMGITFGENMAEGCSTPESVMQGWKSSPGHYNNIMAGRYGSGAIAYHKGIWCAVFMDADSPGLERWRDYCLKKITVRRYDSTSGNYVPGSSVRYYEETDKWGTAKVIRLNKAEGKEICLEVGKTYVFYEQVRPDGCGKAERMTVTITEDTETVELSD